MGISIIIPALNEARVIEHTIQSIYAQTQSPQDIILADGGSTDNTTRIAKDLGVTVVESQPGRGIQMNTGAAAATGDVLLFLHADTILEPHTLRTIIDTISNPHIVGGHHTIKFSGPSKEAQWLQHMYPLFTLFGLCYGDSAIFVRTDIFKKMDGYKPIPLFEDYDFYRRLKKQDKVSKLAVAVTTSSRRFEGRFFRTLLLWIILQILYWLGVNPVRLHKWYKNAR